MSLEAVSFTRINARRNLCLTSQDICRCEPETFLSIRVMHGGIPAPTTIVDKKTVSSFEQEPRVSVYPSGESPSRIPYGVPTFYLY